MRRRKIESIVRSFFDSRSGATAIEYALIAGGISIVIVGGVASVGGTVTGIFETVASLF